MKRFWILISILWLATCGGGGGSPTEPKEPAPVANFTATPTTLIQGRAVTFTSTSTGTITSYAWNVDDDPAIDGTTATYEHTYEEVGTYSITLTVTGPGGSNPKTVADMITVSTAAPTPTTSTSQTVQEDGSTTISLTATDPNGQAVTFAITTDPTNGTATLSGTEITYTPNANFYGTDSVAYTASNGTYTSDPVTITITVEGQDDEPTTNDVSATTDEDTAVTLTLDATEIDGDNYSFSIVSQPTNGTLGSVNGNQVEYTPNQDFNGTDTFTFEATDDRTYRRNVATATITVNPVNDAPVANDVTASMDENKEFTRLMPVTITLDATDVEGDDLTYSIVGTPSNGTLGSITNNQVIYTPTQDWNGEDTFTYKANDGTDDSNTATVTVTVTSVNDAPVTTDQSASTDEDTAVNITLTATDVENDNLTFTIVSDVSNGTTSLSGATVTYTPTQDFNGTDTFTFKANDGTDDSNTSTITITVASVNDAPVANDVTASTQSRMNNMRQAVNITLDATDVEGDDLTYSLVSDVSNGTTSLSGNIVTYTPTANYDGTDTFTYKANDGTADSNTATGTITITDTNQAPIANDMTRDVERLSFIDFDLHASDQDGDTLSKTIVSQPNNGTVVSGVGLLARYSPDSFFTGEDSFTYKVNDGAIDSEVKTVTLNVNEFGRFFPQALGYLEEDRESYGYYSIAAVKSQSSNFYISQFIDDTNNFYVPYYLRVIEFDDQLTILDNFIISGTNNTTFKKFDDRSTRYFSFKSFSGGFLLQGRSQVYIFDEQFNLINSITSGENDFFEISNNQYISGHDQKFDILDSSFNIIKSIDLSGLVVGTGNTTYNLSRMNAIYNSVDDTILFTMEGGNPMGADLYKMDLDGNIVWFTEIPDENFVGSNISLASDNSILFQNARHLRKYDQNGNLIWETGGMFPAKFTELSSGDIISGNMTCHDVNKECIITLISISSSGQQNWYIEYDVPTLYSGRYYRIFDIFENNNDIIIHYTNDYALNDGGVLIIDSNGTKLLP